MSERLEEDSFVRVAQNRIKVKWIVPRGNRVPSGGLKLRDFKNAEQSIVMVKDTRGNAVLRNISAHDDIPERAEVLIGNDRDVIWRRLESNGRLPSGAIRAGKGAYGNMYIGRHPEFGLGMVVMPDRSGGWRHCIFDGKQGLASWKSGGFEVLCST